MTKIEQASADYATKVQPSGTHYVLGHMMDAFAAGAAWQKEHADPSPDTVRAAGLVNKAAIDRHNEIRDALGTLGEGMSEMLKRQGELAASAVRGAERGQRAIDAIKDVGEKVEACMEIANNTEEGLAIAIDKLDKLGVEKWREAIKHVEAEGTTEPMHAEVKAMRAVPETSDARDYEERPKDPISRMHDAVRPTARDVIAMMEKAMLAADEAGVKLDWRVTVGAI